MNLILFLFFIIASLLFSNDNSIDDLKKEKKKIEKEIKTKDKEIENLNQELQYIRKKITDTTNNLNITTQEAIKSQKDLIDIEEDIRKNNKILKSIENDLSSLDISIYNQKIHIAKQENKIDSIQKIISQIEIQFKKRTKKTYSKGTSLSTDWKNKTYLKELNQYVDKNDKEQEERYRSEISKLDIIKEDLENTLKELEIALRSKKKLYEFKKKSTIDLLSKKKKKERILSKLKIQKNDLEKNLSKTQKDQAQKEKEIKTVQSLISKLLKNKQKIKKRTEELINIRKKQNKEISGNFNKMKGKLEWPINGRIVSRFGNQINKELNTVTENIGIDIESSKNESVFSVMDGIVSLITYLPGHGNIIMIDHGDNYSTVYSNIEKIIVYEEEYVSSGEKIATVSTINNKGKLHFQIWKGQNKKNPESWLIKK